MKELFQAAGAGITGALPSVLLAAGAGTVAVGLGLVFPPAGIIAAGLMCMAAGVILIKGGGGGNA